MAQLISESDRLLSDLVDLHPARVTFSGPLVSGSIPNLLASTLKVQYAQTFADPWVFSRYLQIHQERLDHFQSTESDGKYTEARFQKQEVHFPEVNRP